MRIARPEHLLLAGSFLLMGIARLWPAHRGPLDIFFGITCLAGVVFWAARAIRPNPFL